MNRQGKYVKSFEKYNLMEKKESLLKNLLKRQHGENVTQDVFALIKPLFTTQQWTNFNKIWSMVDDASHTWIGKKNIPLTISYSTNKKEHMKKRAWYSPVTNTIMVVPPTQYGSDPVKSAEQVANDVFAELSHAIQYADYKKNPVSKVAKAVKFVKTDLIPSILTGDSAVKGKGKEFLGKLFPALKYDRYTTQGTTEHTAHKIIEPTLYRAVFGNQLPTWGSKYGCPSS